MESYWDQRLFDTQNWGEKEKQKLGNILKFRLGTLQGQFLDMEKIRRGAVERSCFVVLVRKVIKRRQLQTLSACGRRNANPRAISTQMTF